MPGREEASDKRDGEVSADKEKNGDEEKKGDEKQAGEEVELVLVAGEKRQDEEKSWTFQRSLCGTGFESDVFQTVAEHLLRVQSLSDELL